MLAAVRIQEKSGCPRRSDDAATFGLWEQARAGLLATVVAREAPAAPQPGTPPTRSQFHEPSPMDFNDHTGFTQIFDGQSLADWEGDPAFWRVENGAIVRSEEHTSEL